MNRAVLIVTPFFAPQTHAAMFRAYKLAKYLPQFGWKPYVLTTDTNYLYNEDPMLLDELPAEVEIIRARYVEPTLRGLRMALGGQDRTFAALKHQAQVGHGRDAHAPLTRFPGSLMHQVYRHMLGDTLQTPDQYWTWLRPALRAARALIADYDIAVVYTTCQPYTCLQIGLALQQSGCRWIADFRDPVTYTASSLSSSAHVSQQRRRLVRAALRQADAITVLSSAYKLIFQDMYPKDVRNDIVFIPTGVDDDYVRDTYEEEISNEGCVTSPYLVFAGEYLPDYADEFLEIFALALRDGRVKAVKPRLIVVGREELNRPRMARTIARLDIAHAVEFRDHMSQRQLYALLKGARAGVLAPGRTNHWWTNFAKMVDYIGLRIPCVAIVPDPSEARSALSRAGLGIFLDGDREHSTLILTDLLLGIAITPIVSECDRYRALTQVESFANIFLQARC